MPRYSWNTAKVGVKHQSINFNIMVIYRFAGLSNENNLSC
jgi:hypothetical protein